MENSGRKRPNPFLLFGQRKRADNKLNQSEIPSKRQQSLITQYSTKKESKHLYTDIQTQSQSNANADFKLMRDYFSEINKSKRDKLKNLPDFREEDYGMSASLFSLNLQMWEIKRTPLRRPSNHFSMIPYQGTPASARESLNNTPCKHILLIIISVQGKPL